jgi:hypothetical protein
MSFKNTLSIIGRELFQISLITYLLLVLLETFKSGSVSNFFNLNYLLFAVLITGIMMVIGDPTEQEVSEYKARRAELIKIGTDKVRKIPKKITTFDMTLIRKKKS